MPSIQKLRADFKAALAEAEALKVSDDRTQDQSVRLKSLATEVLPNLQAQIQNEEEIEAISLDPYKAASDESFGTPYTAKSRQVGQTHIDKNGDIEDEGPHQIAQKQFKAISEPAYRRAFKNYLYNGERYLKERRPSVYKTLSAGIDEDVGYFIPPELMTEILRREPAPTTLAGRVRRISTGASRVTWMRTTYRDENNIYTSPINGQWTGEGRNPDASPEPTYGEASINVHEYTGKWSISNTALADSGRDLESEFSYELGIWGQLHFEKYLSLGTGVGQPQGLWHSTAITTSGTGVPELGRAGWHETSAIGAFDPDTLRRMKFKIPIQYVSQDTSYIMNQASVEAVSLLKSSVSADYLFQNSQVLPGIVEPIPDRIAGYPITYCQFAPDIANGAYPAIFGSLKGYIMPVRQGMTVRVLDEIEALQGRRVYMFHLRWGGRLIQEQFHKFIKIKAS